MATNPLPKVQAGGGISDVAALMSAFSGMFGSGAKTETTSGGTSVSTTSVAPGLMDQSNALIAKIMGDASGGNIDEVVANILTRAKQEFGPLAMGSNAAGVRSYSDTVRMQLANEAMARATGEAAKAKLDAITNANKLAAGLVDSQMQASKVTTTVKAPGTTVIRTGATPAGKATSLGLPLAMGYNFLTKKGKKPNGTEDTSILDDIKNSVSGIFSGDASQQVLFSGNFDPTIASSAIDSPLTLFSGSFDPTISTLIGEGATQEVVNGVAYNEFGQQIDPLTGEVVGTTVDSGITAADVVNGTLMPPAIRPDPVMPNAILDSVGATAADLSGIPADIGFDFAVDAGVEAASEIGAEIGLEAIGDFAFPGAGFIASQVLGGDGPSVVCTESFRQGLIKEDLFRDEVHINLNIRKLSTDTIRGYHYIAIPIVRRMRTDPVFAKKMAKWANDYCQMIVNNKWSLRGCFAKWIGEKLCFVIGVLGSKSIDYKILYEAQ